MNDINTLRFEVQLNKLDNSQMSLSPLVVEDLLDRIEMAEKGRDELRAVVCREAERADAYKVEVIVLQAKLAQLYKEADKFGDGIDWIQRALQAEAKIEEMESQEPAGYVESLFDEYVILVNNFDRAAPVYLAPGAKGE